MKRKRLSIEFISKSKKMSLILKKEIYYKQSSFYIFGLK